MSDFDRDPLIQALRAANPVSEHLPVRAHDAPAMDLFSRIVASSPRRHFWQLGRAVSNDRRQLGRPLRMRTRAIAGAAVVLTIVGAGRLLSAQQGVRTVALSPGSVLTAATVKQIASASQASIGPAGQAHVMFTDTLTDSNGSVLQVAQGTDDTTYVGNDFNIASRFTVNPGKKNGSAIEYSNSYRIVGGREYWFAQGRWYLLAEPAASSTDAVQPATDPRAFLQAITPEAGLVPIGQESLSGIQLTHLQASNHGLEIPFSFGVAHARSAVARVRALEVWVDAAGIVHRMSLGISVSSSSFSAPSSAAPEAMSQSVSVEFKQLGAPEQITAPEGALNTLPPGGVNTYPVVPPAPMPLPN
ncbi:MAG TPA: hypothetical protein VFR68_14075 [Candidatus Dormibacteraeota bacterium]|nr:hypothetical protein [Candidatus Dormibacteraeota bacterium]